MELPNNIYILVDKYINGTLSDKESSLLNNAFIDNPQVKDLFEEEVAMKKIVVESMVNDWGNSVSNHIDSVNAKNKNVKLFVWTASLSFVVLSGIGLALFYPNNSTENEINTSPVSEQISVNEKVAEEHKVVEPVQVIIQEHTPTSTLSETNKEKNTDNVLSAQDAEPEQVEDNTEISVEEDTAKIEEKKEKVVYLNDDKIVISTDNVVSVDPCAAFNPDLTIEVTDSDAGESNGMIEVSADNDSFLFSLKHKPELEPSNIFADLPAGSYIVLCKNDDGCLFESKPIKVQENLCKDDYLKTYSPDFEGAWQVPVAQKYKSSVTFLSSKKQVVFSLDIDKDQDFFWDATDFEGKRVETGLYKIIVLYENGEKCLYSLTILNQ